MKQFFFLFPALILYPLETPAAPFCAVLARAFTEAGKCQGTDAEIKACQNLVIKQITGLSPDQAEAELKRCSI